MCHAVQGKSMRHLSSPRSRRLFASWRWPIGMGLAIVSSCAAPKPPQASAPAAVSRPAPPAEPSIHLALLDAGTDLPPLSALPPPEGRPISRKATGKVMADWSGCRPTHENAAASPAASVTTFARACAATTRMKLVGATLTGSQTAADAPQSFPFAATAGRCYRVYFRAEAGVQDVHVALEDSAGAVAAEDWSADPAAVVMHDGAVCFEQDDAASVVVSIGRGAGSYALQIWSD
jgi:hypothetical protein